MHGFERHIQQDVNKRSRSSLNLVKLHIVCKAEMSIEPKELNYKITNNQKIYTTIMPSEAAHAFKTSGSTETTATKEEFRLSPIKGKRSISKLERDKGSGRCKKWRTHTVNLYE